MIVLNVTYKVIEGKRDAYINAIRENQIAENCLKEPNCLEYSFYLPINESDSNTVFLLEKYTDEEALEFHKNQSHFIKLQEIKALYVEATDIKKYVNV